MLKPTPLSPMAMTVCPFFCCETDLDHGAVAGPGELQSVGEQILKTCLTSTGSHSADGSLQSSRSRPCRQLPLQQGYNFLDPLNSTPCLEMESVTTDPRQIQQFIHQQPHVVNAVLNGLG